MKILIAVVLFMSVIKLVFGHKHIKGYTNTGLPIYPVGNTYDLKNDKIAEYLESNHCLGVTIDEFDCSCGKHLVEKS